MSSAVCVSAGRATRLSYCRFDFLEASEGLLTAPRRAFDGQTASVSW